MKKFKSLASLVIIFASIFYLGAQTTHIIDNSTETHPSWLYFGGFSSDNLLLVTNSGKLYIEGNVGGNSLYIGDEGISNRVVVTGTGSILTNARGITIGAGSGALGNTLEILDGAYADNTFTWVGYDASGSTLIIDDAFMQSRWGMGIGYNEGVNNSMIVRNGGVLLNEDYLAIGNANAVNVSNSVHVVGGILTNLGEIYIGNDSGANSMIVSNGGSALTGTAFIGRGVDSTNNLVVVTGSNSEWITPLIYVGHDGYSNQMNVLDGALVHTEEIVLGQNPSSTGNTLIMDGIESSIIATNSGGGLTIQNAGIYVQSNGLLSVDNITLADSRAEFLNGTLSFNAIHSTNSTIVIGDGISLTLDSPSSFISSDAVIENNGLLVMNLTSSGNIEIKEGGSLTGSGNLTGAVIVSGVVSPGNSVGTFSGIDMDWMSGGTYEFEIFDFAGSAGTTWDLLDLTGTLDIQATALNPFTIKITSFDSLTTPGMSVNFDPTANYSLVIAQTSDVTNFDVGKLSLDLATFQNPYSGVWSVRLDMNNILLEYQTIPEPSIVLLLVMGFLILLIRLQKTGRGQGLHGRSKMSCNGLRTSVSAAVIMLSKRWSLAICRSQSSSVQLYSRVFKCAATSSRSTGLNVSNALLISITLITALYTEEIASPSPLDCSSRIPSLSFPCSSFQERIEYVAHP